MLYVQVADQAQCVKHFISTGLVKEGHVAMFGWSYGGYMSLMSLCKEPTVFACTVAGINYRL